MSNLLYRVFHANSKESEDILIGMCHHSAFMSMNYLYKKYKPDEIVAIFDGHSWRKEITKSINNPITHKRYKGNRRNNLTKKEEENLKVFDEHVGQLYEYLRHKTSLLVMKGSLLECDDIVAGFVDRFKDDEHLLISSDKDFIQLLDNENLTIIEPDKEKKRTLDDWDGDAKLFMFEKCIRGDSSDNVQSSYPRLRKKKILEAYHDEYLKTNIMEHEFDVEYLDEKSGDLLKKHYKTKDLFEENQLLMDLRCQPDSIKNMINKVIDDAMENRAEFDLISFIRFCSTHNLERISQNKQTFIRLLSTDGFTY